MLCRELPFPKIVSTHNRAEQRAATITSIGKWKPKPGLNKPQRSLSALSRSLSLSLLHNHFFTTWFFCLNNSWQTRKLNWLTARSLSSIFFFCWNLAIVTFPSPTFRCT